MNAWKPAAILDEQPVAELGGGAARWLAFSHHDCSPRRVVGQDRCATRSDARMTDHGEQ